MGLSAATVWECRATNGSINNGGGFVTGASGTDYAIINTPQAITGATTSGAGSAIVLTASATLAMIGNIAKVVSGTNFTAGWYQVISAVAGVSITFDRTPTAGGAGALGVINVGGATNTLESIFNIVVPGNQIKIRNEGNAGNSVSRTLTAGTLIAPITISGYNTTRGDITTGTIAATHTAAGFLNSSLFPVYAIAGASALTLGGFTRIEGLNISGSVGSPLIAGGTANIMYRCIIYNDDATLTSSATSVGTIIDCDGSTNGVEAGLGVFSAVSVYVVASRITSSNGNAIFNTGSPSMLNCVFYNVIAASGAVVVSNVSPNVRCINCTFDGITNACVTLADTALTAPVVLLVNNQVTNSGTFANNARSATQVASGLHSFYNRIRNTATAYSGWFDNNIAIGDITTADTDANEYVNRGALNFRLKTTALGIGKGLNYGMTIGAMERYDKELVATDVASGTKFGQDNTTLGTFDELTGSFSGSGSGGGGGRLIGG